MTRSLLDDAFAHHAWATQRLLDACLALSPEQLSTGVPGTYGSIIETLRHVVSGDGDYLFAITGERAHLIGTDAMDLEELQSTARTHRASWSRLVPQITDPDVIFVERDDDGFERRAATGIALAQTLHHGSDHRSQICTALTNLGVEPPSIDVWEYGKQVGRSIETMPQSAS